VALEIVLDRFAIFHRYVAVGNFHGAPGFCPIWRTEEAFASRQIQDNAP
jgi:hypothetical protein